MSRYQEKPSSYPLHDGFLHNLQSRTPVLRDFGLLSKYTEAELGHAPCFSILGYKLRLRLSTYIPISLQVHNGEGGPLLSNMKLPPPTQIQDRTRNSLRARSINFNINYWHPYTVFLC